MSNWIKIEDKLPNPHTAVLLYFEIEGNEYIQIGWLDPKWKGLEAFGMHIGVEEYQDKITHWMPLPEPPIEGLKAGIDANLSK